MPLFPLQVEEVVIQNLPPFGMKTTFNHLRSEQPHIFFQGVLLQNSNEDNKPCSFGWLHERFKATMFFGYLKLSFRL